MIPIDHPAVLCAVIIARGDAGASTAAPAIAAAALFTVTLPDNLPPQFTLAKAAFDPGTSQAAVIAALRNQIPHGAQVLVQELRDDGDIGLQHYDPENLPGADNDLLACWLTHAELLPIAVSDAQLDWVGRGIGLAIPGPFSAPAAPSIRAAQHAMAMWATYKAGFCPEDEITLLLTAYRAWQTAERAQGASW